MVDHSSHTRPLLTPIPSTPAPVSASPAQRATSNGLVAFEARADAEVLFRLLQEQSLEQRRRLLESHDRFMSLMLAESRRYLMALEGRALSSREPPSYSGTLPPDEELLQLRERLLAALAEVDESRADAARLQDERDAAIRETHEVRAEYERLLTSLEDHAARLVLECEEKQRELIDLRDQAREDAQTAQECIATLERELHQARALVSQRHPADTSVADPPLHGEHTHETLWNEAAAEPTRAGERSRVTNSSVVELRPKTRAARS